MRTIKQGKIYRVEGNAYSGEPAKINIYIDFDEHNRQQQSMSFDAPISEMPEWSRLLGKKVLVTLSIELNK